MTSPSGELEIELCCRCGRWGVAARGQVLISERWENVELGLAASCEWLRRNGMPQAADELQRLLAGSSIGSERGGKAG